MPNSIGNVIVLVGKGPDGSVDLSQTIVAIRPFNNADFQDVVGIAEARMTEFLETHADQISEAEDHVRETFSPEDPEYSPEISEYLSDHCGLAIPEMRELILEVLKDRGYAILKEVGCRSFEISSSIPAFV